MGEPIEVIIKTRDEDLQEGRMFFTFIWGGIIATIVAVSVSIIFPMSIIQLSYVALGYFLVFFFSHVVKGKLKGYLKLIVSIPYIVIGLFVLVTIPFAIVTNRATMEYVIFALAIAVLFFYLTYRNLKKYTNLIEIIKRKLNIRNKQPQNFSQQQHIHHHHKKHHYHKKHHHKKHKIWIKHRKR